MQLSTLYRDLGFFSIWTDIEQPVKEIKENVDLHIAQKVDRMSRTAGLQTGRPNYNMAPNDQNKRYSPTTKRRNLVFEGLPGQNDDEINANIINQLLAAPELTREQYAILSGKYTKIHKN